MYGCLIRQSAHEAPIARRSIFYFEDFSVLPFVPLSVTADHLHITPCLFRYFFSFFNFSPTANRYCSQWPLKIRTHAAKMMKFCRTENKGLFSHSYRVFKNRWSAFTFVFFFYVHSVETQRFSNYSPLKKNILKHPVVITRGGGGDWEGGGGEWRWDNNSYLRN